MKLLTVTTISILLLSISIVSCGSILDSGQNLQLQVNIADFTYSTYLGGDNSVLSEVNIEDQIRDVTIDSQENIIVTGNTLCANFPIRNAFQDTFAGGGNDIHGVGGDAFLTKFDKEGQLVWSTFLGGSGLDGGKFVKVIENDKIIVLGITKSSDFPTTDGAYQKNYCNNYDMFITMFSSNGSMIYSSFLGESGNEDISDFELDSAGNLIISGLTTSINYPVTANAAQPTIGGETDGFLMRLSPNCSSILYSTYLGGINNDTINEISLDGQSNIVVTGYTLSSNFPVTPNAFQSSMNSTLSDTFMAIYNSSGQKTYATYFGGSESDYSSGIAIDSGGNIIVGGRTYSTDFPTINAWHANYSSIMVDGFVTKFSADGQELIFSGNYGASSWDIIHGVSIDSNDNIIVSGYADIDPNGFPILNAFQEDIYGRCDIVIMMLSPAGQPLFGTYLGGNEIDHPWNQYLTSNNLYIVGFTKSANFFTTSNGYQQTLRGNHDGFLFRFDIEGYLNALTELDPSASFDPFFLVIVGLFSILGIGVIFYRILRRTS